MEYAQANRNNRPLIESLIDKAALCQGLSHREAALLLECDEPELVQRIYHLAREIKRKFYGNRIVMFAPLYLSNYCVNGCVYCPYHAKNRTIPRKKLSQEEIRREVIALQDMGHKRLALEAGEDPRNNPIDYILESIRTIYSIHHKNGAIRRVNVNIAATTVENYRLLKEAGIGTYILFQETYSKEHYEALHPTGPKSNYAYHTEAMDRAMEGGIDDVGIGVLFGLNTYRYDFVGLLMHAEHLEATFGVGPHTISVPRICPADDISTEDFPDAISDEMFCRIVAVTRIAVPYTGMIISTRESEAVRRRVLELGVSQISGGSRTSVGGYAVPEAKEEDSSQFDVSDRRTLDEVVTGMMHREKKVPLGYIAAGSTNDFATSLGIPKNMVKAAETAVAGRVFPCDIGAFNGDFFVYVAAFGLFTEVSYKTSQEWKNVLGHAAYILEGAKCLHDIPSFLMQVEYDNVRLQDEFIYGMISNSTSVGGILTLDPEVVDLQDNKLEILLVRAPKNLAEIHECIVALNTQKYNCAMLTFRSATHIRIFADPEMPWTLDGEREEGHSEVVVTPQHLAYRLMKRQ